jgi:hypothetical protein
MGFTDIVTSVDHGELSPKQRTELQKILRERKRNLKKALDDVEAALNKLNPTGKKSKKRKR